MTTIDLARPEYFFNRELSWLKFNLRVLKAAGVKDIPLLERMKFVAIASSNLDEFFMVRAAGLYDQLDSGINRRDAAGLSVENQLDGISASSHKLVKLQYRYFYSLINELHNHDLHFTRVNDLDEESKEWLGRYFRNEVYPVLTPMAVDASRPFPFLANRTLNIAVELSNVQGERSLGFVQVPSVISRIIEVETAPARTFVFLEDIIMEHCRELFPGCKILDVIPFRITRDSDLDVDEEDTDNLLKEIEKSLRKRKRGAAVRLEIVQTENSFVQSFLMSSLDITLREIYEIRGPLDLTCLFRFIGMAAAPELEYEPFEPQRPCELPDYDNILEHIKERDILLYHPYESFDPIVKLVSDAASDPAVLAIKQTLYRVSGNSPIVAALAKAAENGKQVTVLVELKARFDEENNIIWARRLEQAGCHVIYGLVGLKTHAKIILIVRKEADGIKRYVHLGTGNYNDNTAKLYTDMGLLTANDEFGADGSAFFNLLSGYSQPPDFHKLVMAPLGLREKIYELVDKEIEFARQGRGGHIIAKMNSLIDYPVISKLYEASRAGVRIELIVRGICGLKPGLEGISENITVRSIVGRQLEHSRIFYFANGGDEKVFLSSADWMPRNLNDRVELFFPVESPEHIERIKEVLDLCLRDNVGAHVMQANGTYRRLVPRGKRVSVQEELYAKAREAVRQEKMPMEQRLKPIYRKD